MKNTQDKILKEEIESYIRSKIPSISKNIHEAYGEGLLKRAGMLIKQKYLEGKIKRGLKSRGIDQQARQVVIDQLHQELAPHLESVGISSKEYRRALSKPDARQIQAAHVAGTLTTEMLNQHNERLRVEGAVQRAAQFNPEISNLLYRIRRQSVKGRSGDREALRQTDPTLSGSLANKVSQLRQQREQMRQQRIDKIPVEYSQYSPKFIFGSPASLSVLGSKNRLARVTKPLPPVIPGALAHRIPLHSPEAELTGLGRILSKIETIV